jgi:hypothetical protein
MPIDKKEQPMILNSCLPTLLFIMALGFIMFGLLGELPEEIVNALDWTGLIILIFALFLYGRAGIQAVMD